MKTLLRTGLVSAIAACSMALAAVAPASADPDTDFANELHVYGIYGPKDYNAWIGKIECKRREQSSTRQGLHSRIPSFDLECAARESDPERLDHTVKQYFTRSRHRGVAVAVRDSPPYSYMG